MIKLAKLVLILLIAIISASGIAMGVLRPSEKLYLVDGEGFIVYLEVAKSFGQIQNCWFKFRTETKQRIELNSTTPITTDRGELVLPFSADICGIRVSKVSHASASDWSLEAENIYGEYEQGTVRIDILPVQKVNFVTEITREIGQSTIKCSKHDTQTKHCKIVEDNGDRWDQCELYTTIRSNRTFDCHLYNWGRMAESHEHIIVHTKSVGLLTNATVEETPNSIILRCQFPDAPNTLHSCQVELPDHQSEFYIMDGLYNGRYSSYDTVTSLSRCSFEIPKPLTPNEIGLWRIISYDTSTPTGCLYYIGDNKRAIIDRELEQLQKNRLVNVHQPVDGFGTLPEVNCMMPFVVEDCYIRDPNNTVHFPESAKYPRQRMYGKCSFQNLPILAGIWTCGALGHDYDKGILQDIEVVVKPRTGETLTPNPKTKKGRDAELMCRSAFDEPITHCLFVDPQSRVHLVGTTHSTKTEGHVQYLGRGLQLGDCGIRISDLNGDDFGEWKCQFSIVSQRNPSIFMMQLTETANSNATSVGLGVGISIILLLVIGVVVLSLLYRRRQQSAQHNFASDSPLQDVALPTTSAISMETT